LNNWLFIKKATPFFANVNKYLKKQKILKKHKLQYGGIVITNYFKIKKTVFKPKVNITCFSK